MSKSRAVEDFDRMVQDALGSMGEWIEGATGPDHDPEVRLATSVDLRSLGRFHISAFRVKNNEDGEQVLDPHGEDTFDLQEDLLRLQDVHDCSFQTCTFGGAEYVVYLLPFEA